MKAPEQNLHPLTVQLVPKELLAGLVVFLVALPLCLGIAIASGAPPVSGVITGILGGIIVGLLSGSQASVSGPAAGLTAIIVAQTAKVGSFEALLVAVVLAGGLQIVLGLIRAGSIAAFFPSSVIKGLLAAIGLLLILKQIPHIVGHDADPEGDMDFSQPDGENTFSELIASALDIQPGAAIVGLISVALLLAWDKIERLKKSPVPAPLIVVLLGVATNELFRNLPGAWLIEDSHLVQMPVVANPAHLFGVLPHPNLGALSSGKVWVAAFTIALVASLETLLNLEAVDRLDPLQRRSPPNRELLAQGVGNVSAGLLGGLPMTSVIVRSSVNLNAGARTKLSAVSHGVLLLLALLLIPTLINRIPIASLAAILLVTGIKLASPKLFVQMAKGGPSQLYPFLVTVGAIVGIDLLVGVLVGLGVSLFFILQSNFRNPLRRTLERHTSGDVFRIQLANQVSFLNRAALEQALDEVPVGGHVLLDARATDYVDPDIVGLIDDFRTQTAEARRIEMSFLGFKPHYELLEDRIGFVDYTSRSIQTSLPPSDILQLLKDGNERFCRGERVERDLKRQVQATAPEQAPLAVVLSCIDSLVPAELIFDLGIGDIFSVRVAGNVAKNKVLGSMEYACAVAGAKVVAVIGHTSWGAVGASVDLFRDGLSATQATGCSHLEDIVKEVQSAIPDSAETIPKTPAERASYVDHIAQANVGRTLHKIRQESPVLDRLIREGKVVLCGGIYHVDSGRVDFLSTQED